MVILGQMLVLQTGLDMPIAIEERMFLNNIDLIDLRDQFTRLELSLLHDIGVALASRNAHQLCSLFESTGRFSVVLVVDAFSEASSWMF